MITIFLIYFFPENVHYRDTYLEAEPGTEAFEVRSTEEVGEDTGRWRQEPGLLKNMLNCGLGGKHESEIKKHIKENAKKHKEENKDHILLYWESTHFKKKIIFRQRRREGERMRETSMCGCLFCAPSQGPGPQPRHVP